MGLQGLAGKGKFLGSGGGRPGAGIRVRPGAGLGGWGVVMGGWVADLLEGLGSRCLGGCVACLFPTNWGRPGGVAPNVLDRGEKPFALSEGSGDDRLPWIAITTS